MSLIDEPFIRANFNVHEDVLASRINVYLKPAARRLKKWVGETVYADADFADELKLAEANLVMHFLIVNLNTAIRPEGLVKSEQTEGATTVNYLSAAEVQTYTQFYLAQAEEIVCEITAE